MKRTKAAITTTVYRVDWLNYALGMIRYGPWSTTEDILPTSECKSFSTLADARFFANHQRLVAEKFEVRVYRVTTGRVEG